MRMLTVNALANRMGRFLEVFSALRYRNMRLFWTGLLSQVAGQQMMIVTIGWLAFDLTGSPLTLGIVNLLQAVPRILLNLVGGALADRWDQRRIIIVNQIGSMFVLAGLATLTVFDLIEIWHLAVASLAVGFFQTLDEPSRASLFPHLLPSRDLLPGAVPLISMAWQGSRIFAPAIAGFVIASAGAGVSFYLSMAGAAMMAMMVSLLSVGRIQRSSRTSIAEAIVDGTRYVWRNSLFRIVMVMAFANSLFAMGYNLMLPVFAADEFGVDARGLGFLFTAGGIGGILSLLSLAPLIRRFGTGRLILAGMLGFDISLIVFAFSPSYPAALASIFVVGFMGHLYLSSGEVLLQTLVPDELRGRVMGLYGMLWSIMPLGAAVLNSIANFTGAPIALAAGASVALVIWVLIGVRNKELREAGRPELREAEAIS
jgi:MFS family permease